MTKYRLICPRCSASVIVLYPEAAIWELCPGCLKHMWDIYDVQMAEPASVPDRYRLAARSNNNPGN